MTTSYTDIDVTELQQLLAQGDVLLLDVRNEDEVARGIIPGAFHIPLHLLPLRTEELAGQVPLVIYCHSGMRSAQAAAFLAGKSRDNLYNLRGGILAWGKNGCAIVPKP